MAKSEDEAYEKAEELDLQEMLEWSGCASYNQEIILVETDL